MPDGIRLPNVPLASGTPAYLLVQDGIGRSPTRYSIPQLEALIGSNQGPSFATRASLFADLDWVADTVGYVYGDTTEAFNGVYRKNGALGAGSWTRIGDLPVPELTDINEALVRLALPYTFKDGGGVPTSGTVTLNNTIPLATRVNVHYDDSSGAERGPDLLLLARFTAGLPQGRLKLVDSGGRWVDYIVTQIDDHTTYVAFWVTRAANSAVNFVDGGALSVSFSQSWDRELADEVTARRAADELLEFIYNFSDGLGGTPGVGNLRLNDATIVAANRIYVDYDDASGTSRGDSIRAWPRFADGVAQGRVKLVQKKASGVIAWAEFLLTQIIDNTTWLNLVVVRLANSVVSFEDISPISIQFSVASLAPTVTVFTASNTWVRPDGCKYIRVRLVGAGGGGGGGSVSGVTCGSGGSAGGYAEEWIGIAQTNVTVTVGVGGAGGADGADGSAGGTTSFGTFLSATGGGQGRNALTSLTAGSGTGDINQSGSRGETIATGGTKGGAGGASAFGGGGIGGGSNQVGMTALVPGAGGGGGRSISSSVGGDGAAGKVIVEEFYA